MRIQTITLSQAIFKQQHRYSELANMIQHIAEFDCDLPDVPTTPDPIASVLINLLERGIPTLSSPYVDTVLTYHFSSLRRTNKNDELAFDLKISADWLVALAIPIFPFKPHNGQEYLSGYPFDSDAEKQFLSKTLDACFGLDQAALLRQWVYPQRPLMTMLADGDRQKFHEQRVDFAWELPIAKGKFVVEIDGTQHQAPGAVASDQKRDQALRKAGWEVIRISTQEQDPVGKLKPLVQSLAPIFKAVKHSAKLAEIQQIMLIPIGVGRIQRVIAELVLRQKLRWSAAHWQLAIYERDIVCAWLAINDFLQLLQALSQLTPTLTVPKITLTIIRDQRDTSPIANLPRDLLFDCHIITLEEMSADSQFDVLVDLALQQPPQWTTLPDVLQGCAKTVVIVRSAIAQTIQRKIRYADAIEYQAHEEALRYFLQYFFRKIDFRDGQKFILQRALLGQDVIGLLPTGGGKSICYQLPAMLQPGLTLVVDPIKSLMLDQVADLRSAGIDRAVFINSSLNAAQKKQALDQVEGGKHQFVFVSPERLQIREFRQRLRTMSSKGLYFAYAVVDEAHCVSEWGHDFRTAYLRLGHNLREHLRKSVPIIGLTGTASFDVLSDIQRDLGILDEEAVVRPATLERKELRFEIIPVPMPSQATRSSVSSAKQKLLYELLDTLPQRFAHGYSVTSGFLQPDGDNSRCGIIFLPHTTGDFGVKVLHPAIQQKFEGQRDYIGYYHGSDQNKDQHEDQHQITMNQMQERFKRNELTLLLATKAFGMGINKPNVRYTVHFNIPSSIESFYQEAGRAGRDRELAYCFVLLTQARGWSDTQTPMWFHQQSFKGVEREKQIIWGVLNETRQDPSMLSQWQALPIGTTRTLVLPKENIAQLAEVVHRAIDDNHKDIRKAFTDATTFMSFVDNLKLKREVATKLKQESHLAMVFERTRVGNDVEKIIYRLATVGLVTDYLVDYRGQQYEITIQKQPDHFYVDTLMKYLGLYVAQSELAGFRSQIEATPAQPILERCLHLLVDFIYDRIAKKRREAIETMHKAAQEGIGNSQLFAERIHNYFSSSYLPQLTQARIEYTLDTVWEYIAEVRQSADQLDRAKHLRGSCDRLLIDNPENGAFYLLRAFATLLINPQSAEILSDAQQGIQLFQRKEALSHPQTMEIVHRYGHALIEVNSLQGQAIADSLILDVHQHWLEQFSKSYFQGVLIND
jgi:ATP-dependent DNA helicase RecQ